MNTPVNKDLLAAVCHVVTAAGKKIEEIRAGGPVTATRKDDDSPVTRADQAADELLRTELTRLLRCGWLSEETADDQSRLSKDLLWVVDPLDGTKEFVEGLPQYSVAATCSGRCAAPAHFATTGRSTCLRGTYCSPRDPRRGAASSVLSRTAVTLSRGPKHEWDVCAGALIVEEAGGVATDVFGGPLRFNQPFPKVKGILAGAPQAYARALEQMTSIGASDRMDEFADVRSKRTTP